VPTLAERATLKRRTIAWRLAAAIGAVFVVVGLGAAACLWAIFDIHERLHTLKADDEQARSVVLLANAVRDQYAHVAHAIVIGDDSHEQLFRDSTARLQSLAEKARAHPALDAAADVDRILDSSTEMERIFRIEILPLVKARDHATLVSRHERVLELAFSAQQRADALAERVEGAMDDLTAHVGAAQHGVIRIAIGALLLALLATPLVGIYLYRTIARPIATLSDAAARVGRCDLDTQIVIERNDELGQLSQRFNEMMQSMKEHQKRLLQSERVVGLASMSAGIAHELNNPLGVILGHVKLLRRRNAAIEPAVLAAIEQEAERCHEVIEGLLELTRGAVIDKGPVDLRKLTEDAVGSLRLNGASSRASIEVQGTVTASGDASKLRQVLTNLLRNAFEASGPEGHVIVSIDRPTASLASVDVRDTGTGMSATTQERLFEPFFTTKATGSGLGLAISRAIARAHGGDVVLVSTGDDGTAFRLTVQAEGLQA
jgi:two-component system, NtrC family, sensor kinase